MSILNSNVPNNCTKAALSITQIRLIFLLHFWLKIKCYIINQIYTISLRQFLPSIDLFILENKSCSFLSMVRSFSDAIHDTRTEGRNLFLNITSSFLFPQQKVKVFHPLPSTQWASRERRCFRAQTWNRTAVLGALAHTTKYMQ